jgi:hypothetical protein
MVGNAVASYAHILHQQGNFDKALSVYEITVFLWTRVTHVSPERQAQVLGFLKEEMQHCASNLRPARTMAKR